MSCLVPSTNAEIKERINASASSYITESNEDMFKPGMVFEGFHHQARIPISDRSLLAGFLMLWLKRFVMPTLLHEAIITDVVYPAVLLMYDRTLSMLPAMVGCIQSGVQGADQE